MRPSLFDLQPRLEILGRIDALSGDAPRLWGTMNASQALCHLSDQLRFAIGELTPRGPKGPLTLLPMKWIGIVLMPWPHARITASIELLQTRPSPAFDDDRAELIRLIDDFASTNGVGLGAHPMFGELSPRMWGILAFRHLDYHLRQFGS